MFRKLIPLSCFLVVSLMATVPAYADAIDGHWCFKAKRLTIDGPKIVTPGGRNITGDYDRHAFRYNAPAGEREAGKTIDLELLDDNTLQWRSGEKGKAELWKRCKAAVS